MLLQLRQDPQRTKVSGDVYDQVEGLRLEGYAGCALNCSLSKGDFPVLPAALDAYTRRLHLLKEDEN